MNKKNVFLIDGGMGQELIHRSKIKPDGLWGARVMLDNYELVVDFCLLYTSPSPRDLH